MSEEKGKKQSDSENKPASGHKRNNPSGRADRVQNIGEPIIERRAAEIKPRPPKTDDNNKSKAD